jgi:similar to stage IV sporulation protein
MLLSLIKYMMGYLRVQVTGYAPERFLNLCSNHNILMWQMRRIEDGYEFYISLKGFRQLKPFLKKTKTKVRILERHGIPFKMHRYRKRKIFFVGVVIFFLFLFLLSNYIWNIEIVGNSSVTDDNLIQFLDENHCGFGDLKSNINCSGIEEKIRLKYKNIIWASAQISGTKLTIQIKENLVTGETKNEKDDTPQDIRTNKDAVIKSIVTRTGTPLVKEGDSVKNGDILVSGKIDIYNDNGEVSGHDYCVSDADIYGYTADAYFDSFLRKYKDKSYTGETKTRYSLELAGRSIKIPMPKVSYTLFEKTTDYRQLHICSDFYLPVVWCTDTYQEYQLTEKKYTKEQAQKIANEHLEAYLRKIKEKKIQIIEKNVIINVYENYCRVKGTIKMCEKLDQKAPTEILPDPADERSVTDELE